MPLRTVLKKEHHRVTVFVRREVLSNKTAKPIVGKERINSSQPNGMTN
jgi:hypothetical protein